ncbi:uncharacterized protein LOC101861822 [Aplysia californica]|uniref:Uncharacterized protein LOC101861822 n=1 Tax=Aplysia californica TaxID=6500 RepID=A0ABM0JSW2_APLCA|nr:uncharacterized protein LOC101861822 [Aplysia californica]
MLSVSGSGSWSAVRGEVEMSQAFHEKSKQELLRLRDGVASSMKEDLRLLADDDTHKDLTITNGTDSVRAHRCILQARCRHLWQDSWLVLTEKDNDDDDRKEVCLKMHGLSRAQLENFVRQMYTVSDSALFMDEFLPAISGESSATGCADDGLSFRNGQAGTCGEWTGGESGEPTMNCVDGGGGGQSRQKNSDEMYLEECCVVASVDNAAAAVTDAVPADVVDAGPAAVADDIPIVADAAPTSVNEDAVVNESDTAASTNLKYGSESSHDSSPVDEKEDSGNNPKDDQSTCAEGSARGEDCLGRPHAKVNKSDAVIPEDQFEHEDKSVNANAGTCSTENVLELVEDKVVLWDDCTENKVDVDGDGMFCDGGTQTAEASPLSVEKASTSPVLGGSLDSAVKSSYSFSIPYETCSPLGRDLLQMHLQETNCDCCLSVDGVQFLAHKAVLTGRSEYFAAMLGGRWSESNMEMIQLEGVAPQALEQVLLFLYGGVVDLTTPCDLMDLFLLADMYGVLAFKSVLAFYVKKDLCHFFHKPCQGCVSSAPEAVSLCHNFNLDELLARCLRWVSKYFTRIWPTKTFAALPEHLQQLCVENMVSLMTKQNVLDIIMDCDKLTTSLPRIRWTESILCLLTQLMDLAIEFTSSNFIDVIGTYEFLQWAKVASWKAGALEEIFNSVIDSLAVDTACLVYQTLVALKSQQLGLESPDADVIGLLDSMLKRCEKFLRTHIHQATRCKQWPQLMKETQTKILENSSYVYFADFPDPKPKPKLVPKVRSRPPGPSTLRGENRRPEVEVGRQGHNRGQQRPTSSGTGRGSAAVGRSQNVGAAANGSQRERGGAVTTRRGVGRAGQRGNVRPAPRRCTPQKVDDQNHDPGSPAAEGQGISWSLSRSPSKAQAAGGSARIVKRCSARYISENEDTDNHVSEVMGTPGTSSQDDPSLSCPSLSLATDEKLSDLNVVDSGLVRSVSPRCHGTNQASEVEGSSSSVDQEIPMLLSPSPSDTQAATEFISDAKPDSGGAMCLQSYVSDQTLESTRPSNDENGEILQSLSGGPLQMHAETESAGSMKTTSPRDDGISQACEVRGSPDCLRRISSRSLSTNPSRLPQAASQYDHQGRGSVEKSPRLLRAEQAKLWRSQLPVRDRKSSSPRPGRKDSESSCKADAITSTDSQENITQISRDGSVFPDCNANNVSEKNTAALQESIDDLENSNLLYSSSCPNKGSGLDGWLGAPSSASEVSLQNVGGENSELVRETSAFDYQRDELADVIAASAPSAVERSFASSEGMAAHSGSHVKVVKMNKPLTVGFTVPKD